MLTRFIAAYCRGLSYLLAAMLALMVVLVFGNVVLRYTLNSGISLSEELSRWLFVWLVFLGAVVALHERAHLGTDMVVGRLGVFGRKCCLAVSYIAMLGMCWLVFQGAWEQMLINKETLSAVMQVPMAVFYASGVVFAVLGAIILINDLWCLLSGRMPDDALLMIQDSEEVLHVGADTVDGNPHKASHS